MLICKLCPQNHAPPALPTFFFSICPASICTRGTLQKIVNVLLPFFHFHAMQKSNQYCSMVGFYPLDFITNEECILHPYVFATNIVFI